MMQIIANGTTILIFINALLFFIISRKIASYHIKSVGFDFFKILTKCIVINQLWLFSGRILAFNLKLINTAEQLQSFMLGAYIPIIIVAIYLLKKFKTQ